MKAFQSCHDWAKRGIIRVGFLRTFRKGEKNKATAEVWACENQSRNRERTEEVIWLCDDVIWKWRWRNWIRVDAWELVQKLLVALQKGGESGCRVDSGVSRSFVTEFGPLSLLSFKFSNPLTSTSLFPTKHLLPPQDAACLSMFSSPKLLLFYYSRCSKISINKK